VKCATGSWRDLLRRRARAVLCLLIGLAAPAAAATPITVVDDLGNEISLTHPARRIVALAPHVAELLFAAGAGGTLVGAVSYSDYPPAAREIPRVGSFQSLDLERIVALKPDLVIAWTSGNGAQAVGRLRGLGLAVYESEPRELADIARSLEQFGRLAGTAEAGARAASAFRKRHAALAERYSDRSPVSVFYQIWHQPLMTINGEHLISQVLALCGGRNVFADLAPLAATVSVEAVLKARPEAIVASGAGDQRPDWLDDWRRWPQLPAVRAGNLYSIPPDLLQRQGPRVLDGAEHLCTQLQEAREKRH
jgi:iron complex transport system substrate-binding protein